MAVEPGPQLIRDYWPRYKQRSLFLIVTVQIIIGLSIGLALLSSGLVRADNIMFWMIVLVAVVGTTAINLTILSILTEPLEILSRALAYAADEKTTTTPPNPNLQRFENNGLKPLLETIYRLGKAADTAPDLSDNTTPSVDFTTALDETSTGVIFMKDGAIVYANKAAPVIMNKDEHLELDVIFDNESTLQDWVKECENHKVQDQKLWPRVANKLAGEEDRKIYDIVASYQKEGAVDVVLMLLEKTEEYLPEDNDLDFMSIAAHELRGPITVIRGYLDTLGEELADRFVDDEGELFNRLVVSANRLSGYVNNILNTAKYDRRHLQLRLNEESITSIYKSVKDDMELRAFAQNRILSVNFPENLPTVAADKSSIGQVVSNLIDNAIKYSNEGGAVIVSAEAVGNRVEVSISDSGIGMPGNVMRNLFHKFYRSHHSRETVGGTGIGLYISKAIIESHGGTIGVRSVEGEGSIFTFSLPIYSTVADKLKASHNSNEGLIEDHGGWIKNHGVMRG